MKIEDGASNSAAPKTSGTTAVGQAGKVVQSKA